MEGAGEHELNKRKGLWTEEEDRILMDYIMVHGKGRWNRVAKMTGLKRCGKSCRLRWMNYLSPNVKRGDFTEEEEDLIIRLHKLLGNRWALIAGRVPGRTDNQVKNHWNTHLSKKLGIKLQGKRKIGNTSHISSSTLTDTGDEKRLKKLIIDSKSSTEELPSIEISNIAGEIGASILNEDVAITDHDHDQYQNQIQNQNGSLQTSPSNNINEQDPVGYIDDECFFRSFWLCNDHDFHTSTHSSLLEIPDGYPVDMVWHGL